MIDVPTPQPPDLGQFGAAQGQQPPRRGIRWERDILFGLALWWIAAHWNLAVVRALVTFAAWFLGLSVFVYLVVGGAAEIATGGNAPSALLGWLSLGPAVIVAVLAAVLTGRKGNLPRRAR